MGQFVAQTIQAVQQVTDNDAFRFAAGMGVTFFSLLSNAATVAQQVGLILGPLLVLASLVNVLLEIRAKLHRRPHDKN